MKTEKAKPSKILNSCGAVVWRDKGNSQQVLLIKQFEDSTKWSIPKGRKNENEQLEDAARREVFEETGVKINLENFITTIVNVRQDETKHVHVWFAVPVDETSCEPHINHVDCEVADAKWFDVQDLPQIVRYQKNLIMGAVSAIKKRETTKKNS